MPRTTPPNLEGLVRLSRKPGVDIRPALLRVLTDLYIQQPNHTREEEQQYVELALGLLPVVDMPTRAAVAGKLAAYPFAPAPIVEQLTCDVAAVAEAMLRRPESQPEPIRQERDDAEAATPVRFTSNEASARIATDDGAAIGWVERERNPSPSSQSSSRWVSLRSTHPTLDMSTIDLGEAFLQADAAERRRVLRELDQRPSAAGAADAVPNNEVVRRLEQAALQRNEREFARELQHTLHLPRAMALRVARDPSGEPLLVVAWALAMPAPVLQRILLFLNPAIGESVDRVFALSRLYDELSPQAAVPIVASWREEAARRVPVRYVGVHADEPGTGGAALMDNARRSITGRTGEAARRIDPSRARAFNQRTT